MISDVKLRRWCEMISAADSKFGFQLGIKHGTKWEVEPPYPDLEVASAKETHVRRLVLQELVVSASVPEDDDAADLVVTRLVAELEGGREVELNRHAQAAGEDVEAEIPMDVCCACGERICDPSIREMYEGKPYHKRCIS